MLKTILITFAFIFSLNAEPVFYKKNILSKNKVGAQKVLILDLDKDGDMDIISGSKDIFWWENIDNKKFVQHFAVKNAGNVIGLFAIDMDKDGDIDILSASYSFNSIIVWRNDGKQNFSKNEVDNKFNGVHDIVAADVNNDGFLDIIGARGDKQGKGEIAVWFNNKSNKFNKKHTIYSSLFSHSISVKDLDNDGKVDILGTQFKEGVRVWKNLGNSKFKEHFFPLNGAHEVKVKDINKDGKPDILAAGYMSRSLVIWENQGDFKFKDHKVTNKFIGAVTIDAGDIDGDGDIDILGGSHGANDIRWWENKGEYKFVEHSVAGFLFSASGVCVGDIDNDGDADITGTAWKGTGEVSIWKNIGKDHNYDGNKSFSPGQFIKYLRKNGIDKANKLYNKLKKEYPKARFIIKKQFNYLGYEFIQLKMYDKAIKTFLLLLREYPGFANGYDSLAEAYMEKGNKNLAIKNYKRSLELNPDNNNAKQKLKVLNNPDKQKDNNQKSYKEFSKNAFGLWRAGEKEKAVNIYRQGLELYPEKFYKVSQNLVFMYIQLKKIENAFDIYELGHARGLYYPFYIESGPMAKFMKYDRFKKIYKKNNEIIKEVEKTSKPVWEIKLPENYDKSNKYPLLIVLHGWSGSLKRIEPIWKSKKFNQKIIISYLQSSQIAGVEAFKWDDINKAQKEVLNLINLIKSKYKINKKKIIIAGFSQGAAAAIKLIIDDRVNASGFIAHCPGGDFVSKILSSDLKKAEAKGIKGIVLSTEKDHNKEVQKKILKQFKNNKFQHKYIEITGIGHWYPKNFTKYLDKALEFFIK